MEEKEKSLLLIIDPQYDFVTPKELSMFLEQRKQRKNCVNGYLGNENLGKNHSYTRYSYVLSYWAFYVLGNKLLKHLQLLLQGW